MLVTFIPDEIFPSLSTVLQMINAQMKTLHGHLQIKAISGRKRADISSDALKEVDNSNRMCERQTLGISRS
jgi:hypothetical protein